MATPVISPAAVPTPPAPVPPDSPKGLAAVHPKVKVGAIVAVVVGAVEGVLALLGVSLPPELLASVNLVFPLIGVQVTPSPEAPAA